MIAILLAVYNGEKYLKEQIDSIISQMDRVQEKCTLYIHDDGSKDGSCGILKDYERAFPDRVKLLRGAPQMGSTKNFMYMLKEVQAEYYMFSDQDDVWLPHKIEREYGEIRKLEERLRKSFSEKKHFIPALVFADMKVVDEDLQVINESFYDYSNLNPYRTKLNELILENVVSGCCMMFNRQLRDLALGYSDLNCIKWHDWWITEIAAAVSGRTLPESGYRGNEEKAAGSESRDNPENPEKPEPIGTGERLIENIAYIPEPLMLYRQHGLNAVGATEDVNLTRIRKKLSMILRGEQSRETKKFIREAVDQGKQLMGLKDDISEDSYNIIKALDDFDRQGKLKRIESFKRLKLSRDKRNLWMMLHL